MTNYLTLLTCARVIAITTVDAGLKLVQKGGEKGSTLREAFLSKYSRFFP